MKRTVILVIDSMGIGAMPDAEKYSDSLECNTLANVAKAGNGINLPNMQKMGLGNIHNIEGVKKETQPTALFGKMAEVSEGKDTTTGHWEIAGLILEKPFKTYPEGFPKELNDKFIEKTGCKGILANIPASGTAIIDQYAQEQKETGFPIIYTSADSVYQIACNVDIISLKTLYKWCEIAREILDEGDYNVSRVIARPFKEIDGQYKRISADRRDYSVPPTGITLLDKILENSGRVVGIGKIEDIFVKAGISHAIHTGSNAEGLEITLKAIKDELELNSIKIADCAENPKTELIFTNLVDTDMLFGHRNDALGYKKAVEEIDAFLPKIVEQLKDEDLLIITADHGCDPTMPGTDHTREMVPVLVYNNKLEGKDLGTRKSFADIAETVSKWLELNCTFNADSML